MATRKPNILFILTDHQAWYGHHRPGAYEYRWANYDRFCEQGVRFERAYCVAPVCTPARTSMMTGVYPSRHGLVRNTDGAGRQRDLRQGQMIYSHYLARAGYRNGYVGKWHVGHDRLPVDYGVEGWSLPDYGKIYMSPEYETYCKARGLGEAHVRMDHNINHPEWDGTRVRLYDDSPWAFMNGCGILEGPDEAHEEQFVAHLAIEKMKELAANDQPWSLVASFWGPHQAYYPTQGFADRVDPKAIPEYPTFNDDLKGRPNRYVHHRDFNHRSRHAWPEWSTWQTVLARAYAQGYQTDAAIGGILDALDATGQAEDTLVIWCADHGDAVASHGGLWDKASTFIEEVARVPLAVRWPRAFKGGATTERLVTNMDVTATMLDAAGIATPEHFDSRSMLPVCRMPGMAAGDGWPDQVVCQHAGHGDDIPQRIVITDRYKYVAAFVDGDELYDLKDDPFETNNLVHDPASADVLKDMKRRAVEYIEQVERTCDQRMIKLAHRLKLGR